jgi:hypothetical protein
VLVQAFIGAVRQAGIHVPGLVRRIEHFRERVVDHDRQALAAVFRVAGQRRPAAIDELAVGLLEARRRGDGVRCRIELAAFAVADGVEREQHLGGELGALFEDLVDGVGIDFGVSRQEP